MQDLSFNKEKYVKFEANFRKDKKNNDNEKNNKINKEGNNKSEEKEWAIDSLYFIKG